MPTLSVIVIARNEARHIADSVRSAAFADEVIVLDSGSSDDTVDQARAAGAKVVVDADWQGFGVQKNRALALATGDWVFSLDADERITPPLREQLAQAIAAPQGHVAFAVNRRSSFCGQFMNHSGWYPDRVLRLFRRDAARFSNDLVHERVLADGPVGRLSGELLHESMRDLESALVKLDRYSSAGAHALRSISLRYFNAAAAHPDGSLGERHEPVTHLIPLVLQVASGRRESISRFGSTHATPDGSCLRDYIHVQDLCAAHLAALRKLEAGAETAVYNLGNGRGHSVNEVIAAARRVTGHPIPVRDDPPRAGDPPVLVADAARARADLGWTPQYEDLDTIIAHAWQWERRLQQAKRAT